MARLRRRPRRVPRVPGDLPPVALDAHEERVQSQTIHDEVRKAANEPSVSLVVRKGESVLSLGVGHPLEEFAERPEEVVALHLGWPPVSVTSQAPSSHFGTKRRSWEANGLDSNELPVTKTFTSYLPANRASVNGSRGSFVGDGLAVDPWGGAVCSGVVVSDVHEANASTLAIAQAADVE